MKVDAAETFMRDNGFRFFRVRHHDDRTARLEVGPQEFTRLLDPAFRDVLVAHFRALGFAYITLDLQGYRTGSMNEVLTEEQRSEYLNGK